MAEAMINTDGKKERIEKGGKRRCNGKGREWRDAVMEVLHLGKVGGKTEEKNCSCSFSYQHCLLNGMSCSP